MMTYKEIQTWLEQPENRKLFKPTNSAPNQMQREKVFEIANILDTRNTHKPSGCGRCYYNALRAIERTLNIF